jgi:hypothetical protein
MTTFTGAWHSNLNVPCKPINAGMRECYLMRVNFEAQANGQGREILRPEAL